MAQEYGHDNGWHILRRDDRGPYLDGDHHRRPDSPRIVRWPRSELVAIVAPSAGGATEEIRDAIGAVE